MKEIVAYVTELQYGRVEISEEEITEYNAENDVKLDTDNLSKEELEDLVQCLYYKGEIRWHGSELTDINIVDENM